ncbi:ABC transporter C-terminal domain-containing protein, partial [Chryseosolibacter histidini]
LNSGVTDHHQLQQWSNEIQQITATVEEKTLRWLELSELMS